jgi:hypothetical protein
MKQLLTRAAGITVVAGVYLALSAGFALAAPPNPGEGTAPPGSEGFITLMGWGKWAALGICIMSLIGAGVMMGFGNRHGDGGEHAARLGRILGGVIIISAAFSLVGFLVA